MRNSVIGIVLAVVVVAGLFAASHFVTRPGPDAGPAPADVAAGIKDDFIGQQKIGDWLLVCTAPRELPKPPQTDGRTGNSAGTAPKDAPPPPGWKLPRCLVGVGLRNPSNPANEVRVLFRTLGFKRVLTMFLRFPPNEVGNGDIVQTRFDAAQWDLPIRTCSAQFCLVIESIRKADLPVVERAKAFSLSFKPTGSESGVTIPISTVGLLDALNAMRRLNH